MDMLRNLSAAVLLTLLLSPAAMADDAQDQQVEIGVAAYDDGDYQRAKDILLPLAEAGHPKAMNMVGLMHSKGKGYSKHRQVACDWYERSAELGYVSAQDNFALCLYWGDGRPKDITKAIYWNERAAEQGSKLSQTNLATYYDDTDRDKYLYWAQKAAAQGGIKAKALMWSNGDRDLVPDLRWTDLVCIVVMYGWLDKPYNYCD